MVESTPTKRRGRKPTQIPDPLVEIIENAYGQEKHVEIETDGSEEQVITAEEVLKLARLYCKRQGKKLEHKFVRTDSGLTLRMNMRDIRRRSKAAQEQ